MTCKDFDRSVADFVRGPALPGLRDAVEAHTASCARCRARLEAEQTLSRGLGQMARNAAPLEAPVQMEQTLRRAFREQQQTPQPVPFRIGWRGRFAWAAAAAAAVAVALWLSTNRVAPRPEPAPGIVAHESAPEPAIKSSEPDRLATLPAAEIAQTPAQEKAAPGGHGGPPLRNPTAQATESPEPTSAVAAPAREITTDFLPLVYGDDLSRYQGAQLVRVRLPSEALAYFGLPAHGLSGERIPADVLLAEDGTARAVRFVRYARTADAEGKESPGF